jgi:hypothetical protein
VTGQDSLLGVERLEQRVDSKCSLNQDPGRRQLELLGQELRRRLEDVSFGPEGQELLE